MPGAESYIDTRTPWIEALDEFRVLGRVELRTLADRLAAAESLHAAAVGFTETHGRWPASGEDIVSGTKGLIEAALIDAMIIRVKGTSL